MEPRRDLFQHPGARRGAERVALEVLKVQGLGFFFGFRV